MVLLLPSTSRLFSACSSTAPTGFERHRPVDLGAAIGDRTADNRFWVQDSGERDEADCDGSGSGDCSRILVAGCGRAGPDGDIRRPRRAGSKASRDRCIGTAPSPAPPRADLPAGPVGTRCLSALQSRAECGPQLHRDLRAGKPAKRPGHHAAHELLLAARLEKSSACARRRSSQRKPQSRPRHRPARPSSFA